MTEHEQARAWRERRGWTQAELARLTGYSRLSILLFEQGRTPKGEALAPWVWHRYKMACAGVEAQVSTQRPFTW